MFIKIVRNLEDKRGVSSRGGSLDEELLVVPTEHHIFECKEVRYEKVAVECIDEFHELMLLERSVRIVTSVPEEGAFEFVQVQMFSGADNECLIVRDCNIYIMNDEGRTIDKIVCR